jgi:hypothetical protein
MEVATEVCTERRGINFLKVKVLSKYIQADFCVAARRRILTRISWKRAAALADGHPSVYTLGHCFETNTRRNQEQCHRISNVS